MMSQALTRNQILVFDTLKQAEGPLSAYTILDKLREQGFRAPLQVYRALDKLIEYGLVHRLESMNAFVACIHAHEEGHRHGVATFAICNDCGQVSEIRDSLMEDHLSALAKSRQFRTEKTTIEIRGHCRNCTIDRV